MARGVGLTDQDVLIGALIERLMCDFAVDVDACTRLHGFDPDSLGDVWSRLEPFAADGLIRIEGTRVTVTPLGRPFVRAVCAVFDAHTVPADRHARVI
ncbi:hypothetical protein [Brevundimonas denitrificans]|uniref:hypothetical protein n=1 Tax=Brevundimonas denitrificans TaxID=1443434 RepID=UPI00223B7B14|nr:hypothetical protein [Brevundimonas denitrificans]